MQAQRFGVLPLFQGWPTCGLIPSHGQPIHSSSTGYTTTQAVLWAEKMTTIPFTWQLGEKMSQQW